MKKLTTILLCSLLALQTQAQTRTLNDGWTFDGQPVRLPHTWNTDAYTLKDYRRGTGVYERTLNVADAAAPLRYLRIDAACKVARVYVNDRLALTHQGGYSAFIVPLTPHLQAGDNRLRIEVDNADADVPPISADFTFMGGIYRDVWLIEKPAATHFDLLCPLDITADTTGVQVVGHVAASNAQPALLQLNLRDADGRLLAAKRLKLKPQTAAPSAVLSARLTELWSPEAPYLYRVEALLYDRDGRTLLDRAERQVGVRYYAFDAERGFMLNGQPYKLHGVCRHQDQQPYGVAIDDDQHRRDFRLIKQMGANFIRLAHYPQDDAFLDECDRQGMLVWEETPIVNTVPDSPTFADNCEAQLREMIRNHRHHTAIILWGYMNEILLETYRIYHGADREACVDRTLQLARRLEQALHDEDPSRTSVMAFHGSDDYNLTGLADVPEVVGWNLYQGWYGSRLSDFDAFVADQHRRFPRHPMIISEYGAGSDLRLHCPLGGRAFDFSMDYQQRYVEHYQPVVEQTPWIAGGAYWNFIDFSSAVRDESMPRINNKGLVAADRRPKDVYFYLQALWSTTPVVHIATRDWPERQTFDHRMPVKVYSNEPEVELLLNGISLGRMPTANCVATFDVAIADGVNTLRAVGAHTEDMTTVNVSTPVGQWAVNLGSACYYQSAKSGLTWQPDQPYTPGSYGYTDGEPQQTQTEIQLTDDGPLFQSQRSHMTAYRFDVPAGAYELELLFADTGHRSVQSVYLLGRADRQQSADAPAFSAIKVNGHVLETAYMPERAFTAERRRYLVDTKADSLVVGFEPACAVAAIKLRKM